MGEIIITYRSLERVAYWIAIVVLLVLLIMSYVGDKNCDDAEEITAETDDDVEAGSDAGEDDETPPVVEDDPPEPDETCTDGIENQDETDVDCGGSTCDPCAEGKDCSLNRDCEEGECKSGECDATPDLSGDVTVEIVGTPQYTANEDTNVAKLTELKVKIENGEDSMFRGTLEMWVKSPNELYYLNQPMGDEGEGSNPYAEMSISSIASGASLSKTYTDDNFDQGYLFSLTGDYVGGDDFWIEVVLYDNDHSLVDVAKKKVTV